MRMRMGKGGNCQGRRVVFGSGQGLRRRGSCVLFCMGSGLGEEGWIGMVVLVWVALVVQGYNQPATEGLWKPL